MTAPRLTQLWLPAFKSYRDVVLPLHDLTILIGRNGSGKSNALDALEVLSRLARGEEVRDALEGNRRDAGPVRGGIEGCAPFGQDWFEVGGVVEGEGYYAEFDVQVQVRPRPQVVREVLRVERRAGQGLVDVLRTDEHDPARSDLDAFVWNGKRGRNPRLAFRSSHLLTSQLPLRLAGDTDAEKQVLEVVRTLLSVLGGVFHLDPVPHLMRQYVPEQDFVLRRTAENVSAAVAHLKAARPERFAELTRVVKDLPEHEVRSLDVGRGPYGEVMIALREHGGRRTVTVPARQMSDGMLRMLAIATALLAGGSGLALDRDSDEPGQPLTLVIEELENGLHPSQAARVLALVKAASREQGSQVVVSTHSPALLNALSGDDHIGVLLCERDRGTGASRIRRLVDDPGYLASMATARLGDAVTDVDFPGRLRQGPDYASVNALLGVS